MTIRIGVSLFTVLCLCAPATVEARPRAAEYDVFVEAEAAVELRGPIVQSGGRAAACSSEAMINLYNPSDPPAGGYMARYAVEVPRRGAYYVVVWAQGLDTSCTSPFSVEAAGQKVAFTVERAGLPEYYFRYGESVVPHVGGPVRLEKGPCEVVLRVGGRRPHEDHAYNLIADALALVRRDPRRVAAGGPAKLSVKAGDELGPFDPITDFSQGGIGDVVNPEFWSSMSPLLRKLGIERIRIDHVFDYYDAVKRDEAGRISYDWSRLDRVIEQIGAVGAEPFVCLSYMPPALSVDGTPYAPPRDYGQWQAVCRELARHLAEDRKLAGLHYEVWNEPDGGGFLTADAETYAKLYRTAVEGVLEADPTAKVGGPASAVGAWIVQFLQRVKESGAKIDFVTWHWYNCGYDVADYASQIATVRRTLAELGFGDEIELAYSEWNLNGRISPENDSFYNAGSAAATLGVLHQQGLSHSYFFMPKDPSAERELTGWFGAITHTNKPKPVYNLLEAYARLAGDQAAVTTSDDRVGGLAARDGETLRVLVWQFSRSDALAAARRVMVEVDLEGTPLAGRSLRERSWLIDSRHSNLTANPERPGLEELADRRVEGGQEVKLSFELENGGVRLIELTVDE